VREIFQIYREAKINNIKKAAKASHVRGPTELSPKSEQPLVLVVDDKARIYLRRPVTTVYENWNRPRLVSHFLKERAVTVVGVLTWSFKPVHGARLTIE